MTAPDRCDACIAARRDQCAHLDATDAAIDAINQLHPGPGDEQAATRIRHAAHVVNRQQPTEPDPPPEEDRP